MKTYRGKISKQHQWLLTGAVALTLGTVGLTTEVAHAATSGDMGDTTGQLSSATSQQKQVALQTKVETVPAEVQPETPSVPEQPANESGGPQEDNGTELPAADTTKASQIKSNVNSNEAPKARVKAPTPTETKTPNEKIEEPQTPQKPADTAAQAQAPVQIKKLSAPVPQTIDDLIPDKNLQTIVLFGIQQTNPEITDVSQITTDLLAQLKTLDLSTNAATTKQQTDQSFYNAVSNVKSLAGLQYATSLERLVITPDTTASKKWGNPGLRGQLQDISALQKLTSLKTLKLARNQISDADTSVLANLTGLTLLDLSFNNVTDLSFMADLTALTNINFSQDANSQYKITSLKPLTKLVNLGHFSFAYNNISDLSPLRHITAIPSFLDVGHNHIFDITPLLGLNWQPFMGEIAYQISATGQTWTLDQATLNPNTTALSTWSFAYDDLHNFNEFMLGDPQSTGSSNTIGAGNWSVWHDLTSPSGSLVLDWDVSRHNDGTKPAAPNGLQFDGKITVPYTLQAGVGAVTVAFQLDGGVKIAPFVILSGQSGSSLDVLNDASVQRAIADLEDRGFTYEKPVKYNQALTKTTEDSNVTYNEDAQNITLLFSPLQKIYLVDENGAAIGQKVIKESGKTGTPWHVDLPVIAGYAFDRVTGSTATDQKLSGTIQDINDDIYVYYKSTGKPVTPPVTPVDPGTPVSNGTVTVHYQTQTGEKIGENDIYTGELGQAYTTHAKVFANYQMVGTSGNADGIYTAANQDVYYTYQSTTSKVDTGAQPATVTPNKPAVVKKQGTQNAQVNADKPAQKLPAKKVTRGGQATQVTAAKSNQSNITPAQAIQLPQTNEHQTSAWWGTALLVMLGTLLGVKQVKNRKKD